jgi:hypothetical protein
VPVANEDDSPDSDWRSVVSDEDPGERWVRRGHEIGAVEAVEVAERSASGRVSESRFCGTQGRVAHAK